MRLYNGYHVVTEEESYAWLNLDGAKLIKEDAASELEVRKKGRHLEVNVCAGNVFFDVSEKLAEDEILNISTSTMATGIRGTSGFVQVVDRWTSRLYVLEGAVECTVTDPVTGQVKTAKLQSGDSVECVVYPQERAGDKCDILMKKYQVSDIPGYVLTDLVQKIPLCDKIRKETGLDIPKELAKDGGGDPGGRTPDKKSPTPQVVKKAEDRQDEDEDDFAVRKKEEKQGEVQRPQTISPDKALPSTPQKPASPEGAGGTVGNNPGSESKDDPKDDTSGSKPPEKPVGMKMTDVQIQALLEKGGSVSIPANTDASDRTPKKNILEVDTGLSVAYGKTLNLQNGVRVEVHPEKRLRVDGTLIADALTNNGTVTVTSGDTLRLRGSLTNWGTLAVTSTGHVLVDGTFTQNGVLSLTEGAAVKARQFAPNAAPEGWAVSEKMDSQGYYTLERKAAPPAALYTVTFQASGGAFADGTAQKAVRTNESGTAVFPAEPARDGYAFAGWFTAASGGNPVTASQAFTADTTVYAQWTKALYTVTFQASGGAFADGTAQKAVRTNESGTAVFPAEPVRDGYAFAGWFTAASGGTRLTTGHVFTADSTVYAQWTENAPPPPKTFTVTYDANGGAWTDGSGQTSVTTGEDGAASRPGTNPTRSGYVFEGWFTARTGGTEVTAGHVFTANTTVYAQWVKELYTVTFQANEGAFADGTAQKTAQTNESGTAAFPAEPVRSGYAFAGWFTAQTGGTEVAAGYVFSEDTTVYAQWTQLSFTVTFDAGDGAFGGGAKTEDVQTGSDGKVVYPAAEPVNSNVSPNTGKPYAFDGWYDAADGGTKVAAGTVLTADTTLYAHWRLDGVDYEFDEPSGTLRIYGTGAMEDYLDDIKPPWDSDKAKIKKVEISKGVTNIGYNTFTDCSNLTSVTIPEGVTVISDFAFYNCSNLVSVTIPDGVTSIGHYAFARTGLSSVAVSANVKGINTYAFSGNKSLTAITVDPGNPDYCAVDGVLYNHDKTMIIVYPAGRTQATFDIPDGVTNIGVAAFAGCSNLTSVTIPNSVASIETGAFSGSGLTSAVIPSSVSSIGANAFNGNKLASLTIEDGVNSIGEGAFESNLLPKIEIPASVTSIGARAFANNNLLAEITVDAANQNYCAVDGVLYNHDKTSIFAYPAERAQTTFNIPAGVTNIKESAFGGCDKLTSITIPDGVTSIENDAFINCLGLASVTIPVSVTKMGGGAFIGCNALQTVTYSGTQAEWQTLMTASPDDKIRAGVTVHCTDGDLTTA